MIDSQAVATNSASLPSDQVVDALHHGLGGKFRGKRVLVLIPDHTRSLPLPLLFHTLVDVLGEAGQLDFLVALGTHPALAEAELQRLVGITAEDRANRFKKIGLLNHAWDQPSVMASLGSMEQDEIRSIAGPIWHPSLPRRVEICINKAALEHDQIIILGPTFPHEVVGFSGGAKYLFPGISGPDMINATHWLGALSGVVGTIGIKDTPVRRMVHAAARRLETPVTLIALVGQGNGISAMFIGDPLTAWSEAADQSAKQHIRWCQRPYQRVLSCAPAMYDELWTAAKAMYKLEPAVAMGGEVVIFAPHLAEVSRVHGRYIRQIGYHILPYFLDNWDRFKDIPLGVLAHSTHLRGSGSMQNGTERPNIRVTLSSRISPEDCAGLNLGYLDPAAVNPAEWEGREREGILLVPRAGELLYKVQS